MSIEAADYVAANLDARGLPPANPDYREVSTTEPNIGTAAPLLARLHASADLARRTGHPGDTRTWTGAVVLLTLSGLDGHPVPTPPAA
jgi:glucoamylase